MINLLSKLFLIAVVVGAGFSFFDAHKMQTERKSVGNIGIITKADLKTGKNAVEAKRNKKVKIVSLGK